MTRASRRARGELEADVLSELWRAESPLSPADVREALTGDLAYTTVMTLLSRLHDKGLAVRARDGRASRYRPALEAAEFAAAGMRAALEAGQDRKAVLARFAASLSTTDSRALAAALRRTAKPSR